MYGVKLQVGSMQLQGFHKNSCYDHAIRALHKGVRSNYTEMWVSLTHFRMNPPTLELSCYRQYSKKILLQCQKKQCRNVFFFGTSWKFASTATFQAIILLVLWLAEMMTCSTFVPCLHNSTSRGLVMFRAENFPSVGEFLAVIIRPRGEKGIFDRCREF